MNATLRVFALLCLFTVSIVSSQDYFETCEASEIPPMANFNKARYNNLWYIQEMYENEFIGTEASNCYTTLRTPTANGQILLDSIINLDLDPTDVARIAKFNGISTYNRPGYGQFTYNSTDNPEVSFDVTIIETDYMNYSIEWSCWDTEYGCFCWLYVMSRDRSVRSSIQNRIDRVLDEYPSIINKTKIRTVEQDLATCVLDAAEGTGGGGLVGGLLNLVGTVVNGVLGLIG